MNSPGDKYLRQARQVKAADEPEALGLLAGEPGEALSRGPLTSEMSAYPLHGQKSSGVKIGAAAIELRGRRAGGVQ